MAWIPPSLKPIPSWRQDVDALTLTSVLIAPRTVATLMPLVPTLQAVTLALAFQATVLLLKATVIPARPGLARANTDSSEIS